MFLVFNDCVTSSTSGHFSVHLMYAYMCVILIQLTFQVYGGIFCHEYVKIHMENFIV